MATNTINHCTFGGYLGSKPVMLKTKAGKEYTALSIATTEEFYNRETKKTESLTTWVSVLVFGGFAKVATQHLEIGTYVYVSTRYRTVKKTENGQDEFVNYFLLKDDRDALKFWNKKPSEQHLPDLESDADDVGIDEIQELEQMIKGE